jgi:ADP-ribose pyrophosphatase
MKSSMKEKGPYKVLSSREIYRNPWILVREDKVVHPSGKEGVFGIVEMTHGVCVLPVNSEKLTSQVDINLNWELNV